MRLEAEEAGVYAEIQRLAGRIGAGPGRIPAPERRMISDGLWVEVHSSSPRYRELYSERGHTTEVASSDNRAGFLELVLSKVASSIASTIELHNRIEGEDFRRQYFRIREDLMSRLDPAWGQGEHERLAAILEQYPFDDSLMTWIVRLPKVRGRLLIGEPLAPFTWFRVGGPAEVLFLPDGEDDLASFLGTLDSNVPVTVMGVGSNTLVRDGGVDGVVVRLGRGLNGVEVDGDKVTAGSAAPDAWLARKAAQAGVAGLEFYAGIPGTVGGAVVMNAGCYGSETMQVLTSARVMDRSGRVRTLSNAELGYSYRHSALQDGEPVIVLSATFAGRPDEPAAIQARIDEITSRREATQPIREKTGGSTFRNPPGHSSWRLIDEAGWRGRMFGGAKFSELHANFLINTGQATASDLEGLGETVRADVEARTGIQLEWEIKRIGRS